MRLTAATIVALIVLAACGPKTEAPASATAKPSASDPMAEQKARLADMKAAFEAVKGDAAKVSELASKGNGYALLDRGQTRLASQDYTQQQGGFEDMEAAANTGVPEAELWVGEKYAYGTDGYPLKPNSGLKLMEKAADQGSVDAMLAAGLYYVDSPFMRDLAKAKAWYQKAADLGSDKAKEELAKLDRAAPDSH